ncbi:MAG: hypothetical protein RIS86_2005, partial [Planctomycetota bacterium]
MSATNPRARVQTTMLFVALAAGAIVGQWLFSQGGAGAWWSVAGEFMLLRPLQMIVVPLVVLSVVSGIASIGEPSRLGMVGGATVAFYVGTMLMATTLGAVAVHVFQPGGGVGEAELAALVEG